MLTWPFIKGAALLSTGMVFSGLIGEAIGRDTPVTLESACIVGAVIVGFSVFINHKFETTAAAAREAATAAKTASAAAGIAATSAQASAAKLDLHILQVKEQLNRLPCNTVECEPPRRIKR